MQPFQVLKEQAAAEAVVGAIAFWLRTNVTVRRIDLISQPGKNDSSLLHRTLQKAAV